MEFRILGPLRVGRSEAAEPIGAGKSRTLCAVLLLEANRAVSVDRLVQALWGDSPPSTAIASLHNHVMRLRRALAGRGDRLITVPSGYLFRTGPGELDADVFAELLARGRAASRDSDWEQASDACREALALWRGRPLADVSVLETSRDRVHALEEDRLQCLEGRLEADLQLLRHGEIISELRSLTLSHPLRETFSRQLMQALYRDDRQAEALEAFRTLRQTLADELGVEPSAPLQDLHARILNADPTLRRTPAKAATATGAARNAARPRRASCQLPSETRSFTGRQQQLEQLLVLSEQAFNDRHCAAPLVAAIDGAAGIGKTALAVRAAHRLRARFPGGQLFVDLHGHTPGTEPLAPDEALRQLLTSLGVAAPAVPTSLDERAVMYRGLLADSRTLIVLDNASGTAQVRPLLPGTAGCLTLVTSRKRLAGLDDAELLSLDVLDDEEAVALLHEVAGHGRLPADEPAVSELAALCGHMPLAIRITAARLRRQRTLHLDHMVEQLRDEQSRLAHLHDEGRDLRAIFDLSHQHIAPFDQYVFRCLGLVPGTDFDSLAVAALIDADQQSTERALETLLDNNLVTQHTFGRYRFHDLLRLYARTLTEQDPSALSQRRQHHLLDYYHQAADLADRHFARHTRPCPARAGKAPGPAPHQPRLPHLADRADALSWVRLELGNLIAAADQAPPHLKLRLTSALAAYLQLEGPWSVAEPLHLRAIEAARTLDDPISEANSLWDLGRIRFVSGDHAQARELHERALTLYQDQGSVRGQANALWDLGRAHHMGGDYQAASRLHEEALAAYRHLRDPLGQANALAEAGRVRHATGDHLAAAELHEQAVTTYQQIGDRLGTANSLSDLGRIRQATGQHQEAEALYQRSLGLFQDLGIRLGQANTLWNLGRTRQATGDHAAAADLQQRAHEIYRDLNSHLGQANTLQDLGRIRYATGDYRAAAALHEQALTVYQNLGVELGQAEARADLGRVRNAEGDHEAATGLLEASLAQFQRLGAREGEIETLIILASIRCDQSAPKEAEQLYQQALHAAQDIRSPLWQAHAQEGVARCTAVLAARRRTG
ncbi:tetratricopeptide repeat protein [Streptantibioticus parmotrematis]|uniref:AfsR/SARP family transcriptional regulator n=1 Tax=Streptantibioticus parmotrematis TaxID=2873249 RepID=UPI003403CFD4